MTVDKPLTKRLQVKASDEAEINKAVNQLTNEGYVVTRIARPESSSFVTIEAKAMNPKLRSGFEFED